MGREEKILKAKDGNGKATLREPNKGKSAPSELLCVHLKTLPTRSTSKPSQNSQLLCIGLDTEWVFNDN